MLTVEYTNGVGHIDASGEGYVVSFYGSRVRQIIVSTLEQARFALRRLAND